MIPRKRCYKLVTARDDYKQPSTELIDRGIVPIHETEDECLRIKETGFFFFFWLLKWADEKKTRRQDFFVVILSYELGALPKHESGDFDQRVFFSSLSLSLTDDASKPSGRSWCTGDQPATSPRIHCLCSLDLLPHLELRMVLHDFSFTLDRLSL